MNGNNLRKVVRMESSNLQHSFWSRQASASGLYSGFIIKDEQVAAYRHAKELALLGRVLKGNTLPPHAQILDVGCANGLFIDFFLKYGHVDGFDFVDEYVEYCNKKYANNKNVNIEQKDITNFIADKKYDLIFVGGVLAYVDDLKIDQVVKNLALSLNKGGKIILRELTMLKTREVTQNTHGQTVYTYRREAQEYNEMLENYGLKKVVVIRDFYPTYATIILKCKKIFRFIPVNIFVFKFVEFIFLRLPFAVYSLFRNNLFSYHLIVYSK